MKLIYLDRWDGARFCVGAVDDAFDVQAWADNRKDAFNLLDVRRVSVDHLVEHPYQEQFAHG